MRTEYIYACLAGDHRVLQVHWSRCQTEARTDSAGQEEWGEARVPCIEKGKFIDIIVERGGGTRRSHDAKNLVSVYTSLDPLLCM